MRRLSGITVPITLKISNLAAIKRELRGFSMRVGQNVGQQVQSGMRQGMRGAPTSAAAQAAAAGMMMGNPSLGPRGGRTARAPVVPTFQQQLAAGLAHGGQRFNTGPSGGVFAGMGQLTPQQFRNRARLLQQSNALRAAQGGTGGGGRGGGRGSFFAGGRFSRMGAMGAAGRFASGVGFATAPMLTAGGMFGGVAGAAGMGTAMAAGAGIKTFADFEQSFRRVELVQKAAGATQQHIDMLNRQARELGRSTVFSAGEAAEAMVVLSQRGFDATEVYQQLPNVLNLAAAGQMDIADAAQVVGAVQKQFGKEASGTGEIVDILAKAFLNSATDISELGHALSYVGPLAKLTGKDLQETVAGVILLRDAGFEASRAGTGMTRILTKLADVKVQDKFREIGVEVMNADGSMKSLSRIVEETTAAMETLSKPQRTAFAISAFGQRGGPAFGALLEQGFERMNENLEILTDHLGTAATLAEGMMDTVTGQFKQVTDAAKDLALAFGDTFGDDLTSMLAGAAQGLRDVGDAAAFVKRAMAERSPQLNRLMKKNNIESPASKTDWELILGAAFPMQFFPRNMAEQERQNQRGEELDRQLAERNSPAAIKQRQEADNQRRLDEINELSGRIEGGLREERARHAAGIAGQRMDQLRRSGFLGLGQRLGFDAMEHVQGGGLTPGPLSRGAGVLLNQILPGAGSLLPFIPGTEGAVSGIASMFGGNKPGAASGGRPGIFGLEEFQRQVQMGALGEGKELPMIEDHTEKTEKNTGKTNILLQGLIDGLEGAFGLG